MQKRSSIIVTQPPEEMPPGVTLDETGNKVKDRYVYIPVDISLFFS